jgi:hypothetical protein
MDCESEAQQGTPLPALLLDERSQRIYYKYVEPGAKLQLESITERQRLTVKEDLEKVGKSVNGGSAGSGGSKKAGGNTTIFDGMHEAVFEYMEQEIWSAFKNSSMLKAWRGNILHRIRKEASNREASLREAGPVSKRSSASTTLAVNTNSEESLALGLDFVLNSLLGEFHFTEFVFGLGSVASESKEETDKSRIGSQLFGLVSAVLRFIRVQCCGSYKQRERVPQIACPFLSPVLFFAHVVLYSRRWRYATLSTRIPCTGGSGEQLLY